LLNSKLDVFYFSAFSFTSCKDASFCKQVFINYTCRELSRCGTEQEIMSITGHKTSKEIARYTKAASQKKRAERAVDKMSFKKVGE